MRLIRLWILAIAAAVCGPVTAAQGDVDGDLRLTINYTLDDPTTCTREQAISAYDTLDGFHIVLEDLAVVSDIDALDSWFEGLNRHFDEKWMRALEKPCNGAFYLLQLLESQIQYEVLERMIIAFTGNSVDALLVNPRMDASVVALTMAATDLAALKENEDEYVTLELNRAVYDLPRCTPERAIEFYATIDEYAVQMDQLLGLDSWQDMKTWVMNFHFWRLEAWETFYQEPCGVTPTDMYRIESKTYLYALGQMVGLDVTEVVDKLINDYRGYGESDLEIIESMVIE